MALSLLGRGMARWDARKLRLYRALSGL